MIPRIYSERLGPRLGGPAFFVSVVAVLLTGCAIGPSTPASPRRTDARVLLQTDLDFCALAQKLGVAEAFREFAAEDATLLPTGTAPVQGRSAIFELMAAGPRSELTWTPVGADLAQSGDLGYTWGTSEYRSAGPDGRPVVRRGKYLTVWKRQPDGSWKYVMDIGNASSPPQ